MARLDRLGPAREVAQIGAVLGRDFSYSLLRAVARWRTGPFNRRWNGSLKPTSYWSKGLPPDSDYRFKHALIQDAAYENLLKSRRTVLHRRIAETLRDQFPASPSGEPEVLAYHFTQAGLSEPAIEWWGKAGDQGFTAPPMWRPSRISVRPSISLAEGLPTTPALRREQIRLQVALIAPLGHVKGYAAPETRAAAEQARLLIEQAEALGSLPKTRYCCSRSSIAFGRRAWSRSPAMRCESLQRSSWRSLRSKERPVRS